ncbi:hypothetical protein D3C76_937080 [compost metagenome]
MLGFGSGRPIDQWQFLQTQKFGSQAGGIDSGAHRALTENRPRRAIQAIEKQTA